ncbi:sugar-binding transcriptional regulator [Nocardiopsis sp. HUAS JQ3]|uniref:sugar-binding transcriptional regulator n=1 Tax=Nocardiopsis sp. HUAS JQ3 TaxID=3061629 RepID=UPI0023A9844A|nr:sugar-binding domain-containing protein [Nocardiopsis sp. HUAS JQ3]WDZ94044.1 sugar-binding domain-containing protein [Nocardiopsis sp. HUAS JQ3]
MVRLAAIARRFYLDGRSKVEIAEEFGLSRFKVARDLEAARSSGIVRIDIRLPARLDGELSERMRAAFGLRRAIVVDALEDPRDTRRALGSVAARLLSEIVRPDEVLGLAWSRSLQLMGLDMVDLPRCTVVQLNGVLSEQAEGGGSVETVRRAAALSGGPAYPIYAPLILPDAATAATLRADPGIASAFAHFDRLTTAVVAIGGWDERNSTVFQALDPDSRARYTALGVRAEMSAQLFDADGRQVHSDLDERVISVRADQLRRVPEVVAVAGAGDEAKARAIGAALRSGLVSTLVTDDSVARLLLDGEQPEAE